MNHNKGVLTIEQQILYIKILLVNQVAPLTNIDRKESGAQLRACYHHNLLQVELCLQRRILIKIQSQLEYTMPSCYSGQNLY